MKCDELNSHKADVTIPVYGTIADADVYLKEKADEAIAELKAEHHKERDEYISMVYRREQTIKELKADNERLTRELEHVKNGDCINTCDVLEKYGKELCATRRALWLARANRALEKIAWFKLWNASISTMNPEDGARQEFDKWKRNLGKFLKKAEEYK